MLKTHNERYELGAKLAIDVVDNRETTDPMLNNGFFGLVIMGGEKKTPGAEEGSPEEYSHAVKEIIRFKDKGDLALAQTALELFEKAMMNNSE